MKLAPQLTGKAQLAYAAMHLDEALSYPILKQEILERYDICEDTYHRGVWSANHNEGESVKDLEIRLTDLAQKWSKDCTTVEQLLDIIVKEQLLDTLPAAVRVWVHKRKSTTSSEAAALADDYPHSQSLPKASEPGVPKHRRC